MRWIETQILRHLVYHFDENDLSKISNLPMDYWEEVEAFEQVVSNLYDRYEWQEFRKEWILEQIW